MRSLANSDRTPARTLRNLHMWWDIVLFLYSDPIHELIWCQYNIAYDECIDYNWRCHREHGCCCNIARRTRITLLHLFNIQKFTDPVQHAWFRLLFIISFLRLHLLPHLFSYLDWRLKSTSMLPLTPFLIYMCLFYFSASHICLSLYIIQCTFFGLYSVFQSLRLCVLFWSHLSFLLSLILFQNPFPCPVTFSAEIPLQN